MTLRHTARDGMVTARDRNDHLRSDMSVKAVS